MEQFAHLIEAAAQNKAYKRLKALIKSRDPKAIEAVLRSNQGLARIRAVAGTLHIDKALTNLSIQYKNEDFIGTQLLPVVTVGEVSGLFFKYGKRDRLATPDDLMQGRSLPNEVTETRSTANYSCKDYALRDFVSVKTLKDQDAPLDEMADAVACVNDAIAFREEKRIAGVMTTAANFANTTTLSGTSQWNDYTNSDPIADIETYRDLIWSGMGSTKLVAYCGLAVWNKLKHHPKLIAEFKHVSGLKSLSRQQIAEYFELDDLLVSKAWEDTANEGQTASYGRLWGKHFGICRVAQTPGIRTAAFGYTMRHGDKVTNEWFDPAPGLGGGYWTKVGLEEDHNIVASDTGSLIVNAVA